MHPEQRPSTSMPDDHSTDRTATAPLKIAVITLFPEMFDAITRHGITARAVKQGLVSIKCWNPREFTSDRHSTVDDRPYGGGPGMVMMVQPLRDAMPFARRLHSTLTAPERSVLVMVDPSARLLEIATRNADELVADAKDQADRIVGEARTKAERLESESKVKADRLESDARTRSQMLDSETAERRQQLFGDLEKEKEKLAAEVENLRAFEREYRSRLKSYFQQQLATLEGSGEGGNTGGDTHAPKRLKSLLGEDAEQHN